LCAKLDQESDHSNVLAGNTPDAEAAHLDQPGQGLDRAH
jgi:hypothetical protein